MSGLHAGPAAIHHDGTQRGVQLGLTTAGARALLGVPAGELAGELLELEDVAPDLADLPERLRRARPRGRAGRGGPGAGRGAGRATVRPSRAPRWAGRWPG